MKRAIAAGALFVLAVGAAYALPARLSAPSVLHAPQALRVLFVGDLMLDRNVARSAEAEGSAALVSGVQELFSDADLRVANLEGTITQNPSLARRNNQILRFTFEPTLAEAVLTGLNINVVSLANNHALDFGEFGYDETLERLAGVGVAAFGQPYNDKGRISTAVTLEGKKLCFVGYHALFSSNTTAVLEEIATLRQTCWRVIVFAHWGEEYKNRSNLAQREAAHQFIDAGADVVVGAHPHVTEEVEIYDGKAIFYSLGNFLFDQNFSWGTTHGAALRVDFSPQSTHFLLVPLAIIEQHVGLATGEDKQKILDIAGVADFSLP